MIASAFPGRPMISAGAVASGLAVIGLAAISCCAAYQSADRKCSENQVPAGLGMRVYFEVELA
jgi:hypothetical protein